MSQYGENVGAMVKGVQIDPGPGGYYWEVYAVHGCESLMPADNDYLATFDTVEEVLAYAEVAGAQILLQTQAWYEANYDELNGEEPDDPPTRVSRPGGWGCGDVNCDLCYQDVAS